MLRKRSRTIAYGGSVFLLLIICGCGQNNNANINNSEIIETPNINQNININENVNINAQNINIEPEIIIPENINLAIPFQSQAPNADWGHPYQEACEEASIILSVKFLNGGTTISKEEMNEEILNMVSWEVANWGEHKDLTAEETAALIEQYFDGQYQAEVVYDFTWDQVKEELAQNYPIIVPTAGREMGNPNYTAPGPLYHMMVIKGYDSKYVITNDVGTRKGADYKYTYGTMDSAVHDWNGGDVPHGAKVMIVVK
ncbi:MAG: C39 family peptidase [Patescibacteria group bacterium]|jgi:hypothetical protein